MSTPATIRFDDGAAYEGAMGAWSRLAGEVFLDWLAPPAGLRWIDVGCGNGAFSERILQRCAPAEVQGVDPSEAQLAFARTRPGAAAAVFRQGDAMALPFEADRFDAAAMALVIFFVPDPAKGVAEMARVVRPGGIVAAYAWDILGGGFPYRFVGAALRDEGAAPPLPPSVEAARMENLRALWEGAGLEAVATREITVERRFDSFDEFWDLTTGATSLRDTLDRLGPERAAAAKARVRETLPTDPAGRIAYTARANAIQGRVPG